MCSQLCLVVLLATALCTTSAASSAGHQLDSIFSLLGMSKPTRNEVEVETDVATVMQRRMRCARWSRRRINNFTFTCCIANGRLCLNPNERPPPPEECNMVKRDSCDEKKIRWRLGYGLFYDFQLCTQGQGPPTRCINMPPIVRCDRTPMAIGRGGGDEQQVVAQTGTGATRYGPCYCKTDSNGKQICDPRCG